jgi:hypothetical protein
MAGITLSELAEENDRNGRAATCTYPPTARRACACTVSCARSTCLR